MSDNTLPDARWGNADAPLPDWREELFGEDDADDDEERPTPPDVIEALGFDPAEEPNDDDIGSQDGSQFAFEEELPAQDIAPEFAFDRSVRSYDGEGRLHVAATPISKAVINEYFGWEIPDAEKLGLNPDRKYRLYRDPAELAKAAPTFNNIPILSRHVPITADSHRPDLTVGATGTEANFNHPYLHNSLCVWSRDAIDGIESEEKKQLSSAYRYRADMTPGVIDGQKFDGVMRDIRGNHVALVPEGRAGDDVVVGDSKPQETNAMPTTKPVASVSRKALHLHGALAAYLMPKIAQDKKAPDLRTMLKGVTAKNWPQRRKTFEATLPKALEGRLAQDASIEDIHNFIDSLDKPEAGNLDPADLTDGEEGQVGEVPADPNAPPDPLELPPPNKELDPNDEDANDVEEFEGKETPEEEILEYLSSILSPEQMAHVKQIAQAAAEPGAAKPKPPAPPPAAPPPKAEDQEPDDTDEQTRREEADMNNKTPGPVDRAAMDAAITAAVKAERVRSAALREAEKAVRPWIGDIAIAQDSAEQVYRLALDSLGVKLDGVHPSAWRTILEMQPKPSERRTRSAPVAMDAAAVKSLAERFPHINRLKQI